MQAATYLKKSVLKKSALRKSAIPLLLLFTLAAAIMAPSEQSADIALQANSKVVSGSANQALTSKSTESQDQKQTSQIELNPAQERQALANEPVDIFYQENLEEKAASEARLQQARQAQLAPPLPYLYMGRQDRNGEQTIFLTRADTPYVVHVGDVIDGQYRLDSLRADTIQFTYLPLAQKQILNIGTNP